MVRNKVTYLRRYTPILLKTLSFKATTSANPLLMALTQLSALHNGRKIDRSFYKLVAFTDLKNNIHSGLKGV